MQNLSMKSTIVLLPVSLSFRGIFIYVKKAKIRLSSSLLTNTISFECFLDSKISKTIKNGSRCESAVPYFL